MNREMKCKVADLDAIKKLLPWMEIDKTYIFGQELDCFDINHFKCREMTKYYEIEYDYKVAIKFVQTNNADFVLSTKFIPFAEFPVYYINESNIQSIFNYIILNNI